jgi:hypothetical protein
MVECAGLWESRVAKNSVSEGGRCGLLADTQTPKPVYIAKKHRRKFNAIN